MMIRAVLESRHKFIYYDNESIDSLRELSNEYVAKLNSTEPIVIHILDETLPVPSDNPLLNKDIINSFHNRYYELLIFLSIIDEIINHINNEELNKYLLRLFKMVSYCGNAEIKDVKTLRTMLIDSKNIYKETYIEYITTGNYGDFYNKVPIKFVMLDNILPVLKEKINLEEHFNILLELKGDISKYTSRAINDYIASRCNGYLSMNVLLESETDWKSWHSNNGQLIEWCHDYTNIDLRTVKKRTRQN
ncbi:MAG: hypothetical protein IJE89_03435 [Bacilli bacterium]|nr:hypothetical protein [Bacilli bacterium]